MEETLKKTANDAAEPVERTVNLCIHSHLTVLYGTWQWDMHSSSVYCSDVISFPPDFIGTKGIVHPDDVQKLSGALEFLQDGEILRLDFRLITTYGEVKTISGQRVSIDKKAKQEEGRIREAWEKALRDFVNQKESEAQYLRKELAEITEKLHNIGSWYVNSFTGETWYSDNMFRIHNLPVQSLNAHPNTFNAFIHPDDQMAVLDAFEKAYKEQLPLHLEYRILLPNGETRYLQQVTHWTFGKKGDLIFTGIVQNITEEQALNDTLYSSESRLRLYQQILGFSEQQANVAYWYVNLVTRKTVYSEHYYRMYGIKNTQFVSNNYFINLVHPEDREKVNELTNTMFKEHVLAEAEFRIIRPDGKLRYLRQNGKLFISSRNELIMVGSVQDITVRKGLDKKIEDLNEVITLHQVANEIMEQEAEISAITWFYEGYMKWSSGFFKLLGYKPGAVEPMQRLVHRQIHPEDLKTFKDAEALVMDNQSHDDVFFRIVSKNGLRQLKISFRQVHYGVKQAVVGVVHDVTRQMELQNQLAENIRFGQLLSDTVKEIIILTNKDNNIISWNSAAEEKTGIKKDDALYANLFDIFPSLNEENYLNMLYTAKEGSDTSVLHARFGYMAKPHNYYLCSFKNENEEVHGVLHVVQDISKELELQQQLSERLNFIESLVESSVDMIVVLDKHMNYLYWNKRAEEYYAINKQRVIGKNILEVFPSFRNHPGYQEFRKVLKGETVYLPATSVEESNEYFETYLTPIKDDRGEVTAVLWTVHDLSSEYQLQMDQLKATDQLAKQEVQYGSLVENTPDVITRWDKNLKLIYANSAFETKTGVARESLYGKSNIEMGHHEDIAKPYMDSLRKVLTSGELVEHFYSFPTPQGETFFFTRLVPEKNINGDIESVLAIARDITAIKKAEDEIQQKQALLQATMDSSMDMIEVLQAVRDENGEIVDFKWILSNHSAEEVYGDVIGKSLLKTNYGLEQEGIFNIFIKVVETGIPDQFERHYLHEQFDGWFYQSVVKLGDGVATTTSNISKKAERTIKQMLNGSLAGIAFLEAVRDQEEKITDFIFKDANKATEMLLDRRVESLKGRRLLELWPGVKDVFFDEYIKVVETGQPFRVEKYYDGEGLHHWFDISGTKNGDGFVLTFLDITEQKKAQEDLKKNLTILQHTEELAKIGSWEYEIASGNFTWSEGMYELFGLPRQMKVSPEIYSDFAMEEDRSIAKRIINNLKKKHQSFEEVLKIKREHEIRLLRIKASVVTDENGKAQKMVGVDLDITDIHQAEEKLKESQHWLQQTARASPDSITIYDMQRKSPIYLNNCLSEWTQIPSEELVEMGIEGRLKLVHKDDRLKLLHFNEKISVARDNEVLTCEYRIIGRHDKLIWILNRSKVFQRNASGKVTHILSILQDITEEVKLKEELQRRTEYAESIIDASIDRIAVYDNELRVLAWNSRAEEVTGIKKEAILGKKLLDVFPKIAEDQDLLKAHVDALRGEYVNLPVKKGVYSNYYYERFFMPLKNEAGDTYAVVNIMHDVSELMQRNQELNQLNITLEQKNKELINKNEEITSFAFIASHDLKEPLRKISTFSDWLLNREIGHLSPTGKVHLKKIANAVKRMDVLIEDVLLLTKIDADEKALQLVDLNAILERVRAEMNGEIEAKGAEVLSEKLPVVMGNDNQVFYLFKNLVSNAVKFQSGHQPSALMVTADQVSGESLPEPVRTHKDYHKISFEDNGLGIEEKYFKKIFQVFQRLHNNTAFEGTGMGLAICKKIMDNHGGFITVESTPGKGSTFSCYFPIV